MELLNNLIIFINYILDFKVFENVTILELLIYFLLVTSVISFISIGIKRRKN